MLCAKQRCARRRLLLGGALDGAPPRGRAVGEGAANLRGGAAGSGVPEARARGLAKMVTFTFKHLQTLSCEGKKWGFREFGVYVQTLKTASPEGKKNLNNLSVLRAYIFVLNFGKPTDILPLHQNLQHFKSSKLEDHKTKSACCDYLSMHNFALGSRLGVTVDLLTNATRNLMCCLKKIIVVRNHFAVRNKCAIISPAKNPHLWRKKVSSQVDLISKLALLKILVDKFGWGVHGARMVIDTKLIFAIGLTPMYSGGGDS